MGAITALGRWHVTCTVVRDLFGREPQPGVAHVDQEETMIDPALAGQAEGASELNPFTDPGMPNLSKKSCWAVVLAGGEGMRLRPLVRQVLGDDRPKQYVRL